jgi:hypothetical protein
LIVSREGDFLPAPYPGSDGADQSPILILTDLVALKPGCWIIQNSAVGRLVIVLAKVSAFRKFNAAVFQRLTDAMRDIDGAASIAANADGVDVRVVPSASPGFRYPREPVTSLQAGFRARKAAGQNCIRITTRR